MKLSAGVALVGALALGPAVAASAARVGLFGSGVTSGGAAAVAGTQELSTTGDSRAGGGSNWQWGVIDGRVFSNYFHESRCHGSTAWGKEKKQVTGVPGNRWSYASTPQKVSGNTAYYHLC